MSEKPVIIYHNTIGRHWFAGIQTPGFPRMVTVKNIQPQRNSGGVCLYIIYVFRFVGKFLQNGFRGLVQGSLRSIQTEISIPAEPTEKRPGKSCQQHGQQHWLQTAMDHRKTRCYRIPAPQANQQDSRHNPQQHTHQSERIEHTFPPEDRVRCKIREEHAVHQPGFIAGQFVAKPAPTCHQFEKTVQQSDNQQQTKRNTNHAWQIIDKMIPGAASIRRNQAPVGHFIEYPPIVAVYGFAGNSHDHVPQWE